jgi:hypothetical protein
MSPRAKRYSAVALSVVGAVAVIMGTVVAAAHFEGRRRMSQSLLSAELEVAKKEQAMLEAQLARVKKERESTQKPRDGSWLCERHRCNEGDATPAGYRRRGDELPYSDPRRALPPGLDRPRARP